MSDIPIELQAFIQEMEILWYETNTIPAHIGLFDDVPEGYDVRGRFYESGYDAYMALAVVGISGIGAVLYDTATGAWYIAVARNTP